eukprot:TRINITY_DN3724_c0_g1_i1.p1 TRINITY_DN3724_c0_g1~~TRINITY_DN3724_c0_g1_i1.p1  ORF type:complete len:119 (-),score=15.66 TRINITY_DN3724_c0_g1_i1:240-596(-)
MARLLRFGFLLLLLSSFAVVSAMRPLDSGQDPAHGSLRALSFSSSSDDKTVMMDDGAKQASHGEDQGASGGEFAEEAEEEDDNCENSKKDKDECLTRRMLVAHTDYIYTQQHGRGHHP